MLRRLLSPRPLPLAALVGAVTVLALARLGVASADTANVAVGDNTFTASTITITEGDTVVWTDNGVRPHTVTADDASFDSGNLSTGQTFSRTFTTAGTIRYYCKLHGAAGGIGMSGTIVVQAAQATTTTAATTTTTTAPAATTTTAAAAAAPAQTTTTTEPAAVLSATAERTTAAAASSQPASLASTGGGPYTAAIAAIGLALLLTGATVVWRTRQERADRTG
jgi:plastocyanin